MRYTRSAETDNMKTLERHIRIYSFWSSTQLAVVPYFGCASEGIWIFGTCRKLGLGDWASSVPGVGASMPMLMPDSTLAGMNSESLFLEVCVSLFFCSDIVLTWKQCSALITWWIVMIGLTVADAPLYRKAICLSYGLFWNSRSEWNIFGEFVSLFMHFGDLWLIVERWRITTNLSDHSHRFWKKWFASSQLHLRHCKSHSPSIVTRKWQEIAMETFWPWRAQDTILWTRHALSEAISIISNVS